MSMSRDSSRTAADDTPQAENTYVIDVADAREMARLVYQDRLITKHTGGLFAERTDFRSVQNVLDLACGPGGWALQVAHADPELKVVGIDISQPMIQYARAQAVVQGVRNAEFHIMNVLQPLAFPDQQFDLVNARLLLGFMPPAAWPSLVRECFRILRPGGILRLTEAEYNITNSPANEQFGALFTTALAQAGQSFSPDGRHICITPMLGQFLREAGFEHLGQQAHAIDVSVGAEAHESAYQDALIAFKLIRPFLVKQGVATEEEAKHLYHRVMEEMASDEYRAIWFLLTAWGERPSK